MAWPIGKSPYGGWKPPDPATARAWASWVANFQKAVRERQWPIARTCLKNMFTALKNKPEYVQGLLKDLKNLRTFLEAQEAGAEILELLEAINTILEMAAGPELFAGAVVAAAVAAALLLLSGCASHSEEPPPIPKEYRNDPTLHPMALLEQVCKEVVTQMRRQCPCSHSASAAALGSGFASQQLAFQGTPMPPLSLPGGGGGGGTTGGGGPRGNPVHLPKPNGKPLPLPSNKGTPGETLPGKPPVGACLWPLCRQLQGKKLT